MTAPVVSYDKSDGIARVTLDRPQALNAYSIRMRDELFEVLGAIRDDPDVRVVILKGTGKSFCAGADLTEFLTAPPPVLARRVRWAKDVWGLVLSLTQPLIAALHGYILGSGIEIALCCDIRLAAEDARFGLPEVGLGIIPAAGGTQTMPRAAGPGPALDMMLTNRWINASEARRIRLVNRVYPPAELLPAAEALARHISRLDPAAVTAAKQAVTRGLDLSLAEGLELEARLAQRLAQERAALQGEAAS